MENWVWISLYIVQTFIGAVLWRKFLQSNKDNSGLNCFILSAMVFPNILVSIVVVFDLIDTLVDFLAGVKKAEK